MSSYRRQAGPFDLSFRRPAVLGLLLCLVALPATSQLPDDEQLKQRE